MKINKLKLILITTLAFVPAFIVNVWFSWETFKFNLNVVPKLQSTAFFSSEIVIVIMNLSSNIFTPTLCAFYLLSLYLLSHRRFEVLVFLLWFILISSVVSILKTVVGQPRPFMQTGNSMKMLQWTCYSEFGSPSGHSLLVPMLLEFIIRFLISQASQKHTKLLIIFLGIFVGILVLISRVILGAHAINQVLFGISASTFLILCYYTWIRKSIIRFYLNISRNQRKTTIVLLTFCGILFSMSVSLTATFVPRFNNNEKYLQEIHSFPKCKSIKMFESFQYRCLKDSSLIMAAFGVILGLVFLKQQDKLMKVVIYPRNSKKYVIRVLLSAILAAIPVVVFMNPFWKKIQLHSDSEMAIFIYFLHCLGLFLGTFVLVGLAPAILHKLKLQRYFSHDQGKNILHYKNEDEGSQKSIKSISTQKEQKLLDQWEKNQSICVPPNNEKSTLFKQNSSF